METLLLTYFMMKKENIRIIIDDIINGLKIYVFDTTN
jgi:hypothetical protein